MGRPTAWVLTCLAAAVAAHVACGAAPEPESGRDANLTPPTEAAATPTTTSARQGEWRVVFLGDSLTAGLGLPVEQAFPALIERRLRERGRGWTVVNAGVSGDTSAGGLRRLDWAIDGHASIVVVALGGNDALRGLPTDDLAKNLDAIVTRATSSGAAVVLAGMEAPPNNGPEYTDRFRRVYREVAARHDLVLVPFLLEGVAGIPRLNQADGIHPNEAGAVLVADTVWRALAPLVQTLERTPGE